MSEPNVNSTIAKDASKAGNVIDSVLKPKVTVPLWALLVAAAAGNVLGVIFHV